MGCSVRNELKMCGKAFLVYYPRIRKELLRRTMQTLGYLANRLMFECGISWMRVWSVTARAECYVWQHCPCASREIIWGSTGIAPLILNYGNRCGQLYASPSLPHKRAPLPRARWIGESASVWTFWRREKFSVPDENRTLIPRM